MTFDLTGADEGVLRLQIKADGDQLACDNEAFAVINPPRRSRVLLVTSGNEPLEMALGTKAAGELAEVRVERPEFLKGSAYAALAAGGGFDLVIYDRCRPAQMPRANTLFIGSLPPEGGWTAKPKAAAPQIIDTAVSHPLLQWIDLGDVALAEGTPLGVPRRGHHADRFGGRSHAGRGAPRGLRGRRGRLRAWSMQRRRGQAAAEPSAPTGSFAPVSPPSCSTCWATWAAMARCRKGPSCGPAAAVTLDPPDPKAAVEVRTPTGKAVALGRAVSGRCMFTATNELGIYEAQANGKTFQRFAVNLFDPAESDIRLDPGHDPVPPSKSATSRSPARRAGRPGTGKSGRNCSC